MRGLITFVIAGMTGRVIAKAVGIDLNSVPIGTELSIAIIYLLASKAADLVEKHEKK